MLAIKRKSRKMNERGEERSREAEEHISVPRQSIHLRCTFNTGDPFARTYLMHRRISSREFSLHLSRDPGPTCRRSPLSIHPIVPDRSGREHARIRRPARSTADTIKRMDDRI